jgi:hypothetical protein
VSGLTGKNRAMQRWMPAVATLFTLLVGCSSTSSTSSTSPAAVSPTASVSASCVNKTEYDNAIQAAQDHVSAAVTAATSLNFGTAKDELQQAGQSVQDAGNIVGDASPDVKNDLQSAGESVNKAITDLQNNNGGAAATDLAAAGAALTQATQTDANDFFC